MHFQQRRRGSPRAVLIGLLILLLGALAFGLWLVRDEIFGLFETAPAPAPLPANAVVLGLSPWDGSNGFAAQADEAAQKAYLDDFVAFAAQHGAQGVLVHLMSGSGEDALTFGRDRAFDTIANVKAGDKLFQKFDAMQYLSETARAQGLAVLAAVPPSQEDSKIRAAALRAMKKYGLANVYERPEQSVFDTAVPTGEQGAVSGGVTQMESLVNEDFLACTANFVWEKPEEFLVSVAGMEYPGILIDDYVRAQQMPEPFLLLMTAMDKSVTTPTALAFTPTAALAVTYPAADAKIYTAQCFVMGTSDPGQPLTVNGTEVTTRSASGFFGVLVDVASGENTVTLAQGAQQIEHKFTRPTGGGGGGTGGGTQRDGTLSVAEGSYVSVSQWIAGLLYDPASDGNISETVRQGGVARVVNCVETKRSGKKTWAYQLESGDYILAYNTSYIGPSVPRASFTGAAATAEGREETLLFTGSGTPLAYANLDGNDLVLHFYDTDLAPDFAVTGSSLVTGAVTSKLENGAMELRLQGAKPLHGFSVEYEGGTVKLLLKGAPVRSTQTFGKPLAGVSVLLDPGHGMDDTGAMGVAGRDAPQEKDVNLAVALAARYRLQQMGATVHMIREDDSFLTLTERNQKITELKPDFFISVHHNSVELTVDANNAAGTECYYFYNSGKPLAETLVQNMTSATSRADRGAKWGYYYVARNTLCPAVLLECGFMVNPVEYENVTDPAVILREGDAIARAVLAMIPGA